MNKLVNSILTIAFGLFASLDSWAQPALGDGEVSASAIIVSQEDTTFANVTAGYGFYAAPNWLIKLNVEASGFDSDDTDSEIVFGGNVGVQYNFNDSGSTPFLKFEAYQQNFDVDNIFGVVGVGYRSYFNEIVALDSEISYGAPISEEDDDLEIEDLILVRLGFTIFLDF